MRFAWTFYAGLAFAGLTLLISAPLWAGIFVAGWVLRGELWTTLSGESLFAVRNEDGRTSGRMINVGFRTIMVAVPGEPRPRRLLLRLEVRNPNVFAEGGGEGRVRLDAWPMDDAVDLRKPAMYTVVAPGTGATVDEDGMLVVERGARRSAYALASGRWLFDSDTQSARFAHENERQRHVALATADDELPAGAIAVLTYASAQSAVRRLLLTASDPLRARMLRTSVPLTRPVARHEDATGRVVELPLPAGLVRIPMVGDDLDLARATVPAGLALTEIRPWRGK